MDVEEGEEEQEQGEDAVEDFGVEFDDEEDEDYERTARARGRRVHSSPCTRGGKWTGAVDNFSLSSKGRDFIPSPASGYRTAGLTFIGQSGHQS